MHQPRTRRAVLAGLGGLTALAGCLDGDRDPTPTDTDQPISTATETTTTSESTTDDALDLREANVVGVTVESGADGTRFDVTLFHDDAGESGYANWWQVERLDGTRLGRRELLHAHGTQRFTRSATIDVGDADCVVVRGHDQTHGYGGRAMLVRLATGATRAVDRGAEPVSVADRGCP